MPTKKRRTSRKKAKKLPIQLKFAIIVIILVLLSPFYYGYILRIASATWFWFKHPNEDKNYPSYESYNIKIPKNYIIHGIDISYYQGKVDWQRVKQMKENEVHISFAFIKATEGLLTVDPYFQRNWREAPKAGIKVGAYHFLGQKDLGYGKPISFCKLLR